jgi:16S rRNA (guanine527-N7)-methyltransferase
VDPWRRFSAGFRALQGRPPAALEIDSFAAYLALLLRWNRGQYLTAYTEPEEILEKLFLDSLLFLPFLPFSTRDLLDVGSGAGIPGVPLAIARPDIAVTLIEARRRKVSFLKAVVRDLPLGNVSVIEGWAETLLEQTPGLQARFDAVVTRASGSVGSMRVTACRFLKLGGIFVASGPPKGKERPAVGGSWEVAVHPTSRLPRQFYVWRKSA